MTALLPTAGNPSLSVECFIEEHLRRLMLSLTTNSTECALFTLNVNNPLAARGRASTGDPQRTSTSSLIMRRWMTVGASSGLSKQQSTASRMFRFTFSRVSPWVCIPKPIADAVYPPSTLSSLTSTNISFTAVPLYTPVSEDIVHDRWRIGNLD